MASDVRSESSGSDSGSTPEEERIRRLFQTCDGNGDGFIDCQDLLAVCRQLNLEHCIEEIMEQLGADEHGMISYSEFLRRRMQLINEINALTVQEQEQEPVPHVGETDSHQPNSQQVSPAPGSSSTGIWPTSSDTSQASGKHDSWEFDSGARDLSPELNTLQKLIEKSGGSVPGNSSDLLELANKLHLAALASLKGEILELTQRVQHLSQERDMLERQVNRAQLDRLRLARDHEERLDHQAQRYEERLTELHSIIAELSKKLDIQRATVIKEEDEFSQQSEDESKHSETQSQGTSNAEVYSEKENESNTEQLRFPEEEEDSVKVIKSHYHEKDEVSSGLGDNESFEDRTYQVYRDAPGLTETRATSCHSLQISQLQEEVVGLRAENSALQEQLGRHEAELNRARTAYINYREDKDRLQRKLRDMQAKLAFLQSQGSQTGSSPTLSKTPHINPTTGERTPTSKEEAPIAKMAERVRLKKMEYGDRQILGSEISTFGVSTTKVAEHLVQNLQEDSHTQEIFQSVYSSGSAISESKVREFEVELERLNSKIEHLKSQNDLLTITLEESRSQCDRMSVLLGKYESNNTALQLAVSYSDQTISAFEVLLALMETEQGLLLANCRAAGLGALVKGSSANDEIEITALLKKANDNRRSAETVARHFIQKLDRNYGIGCSATGCNINPWEEVSSHSHNTSTTSSTSSSNDGEFTKVDEQRLRDYIHQLKTERSAVKTTVVELESVHIDTGCREPSTLIDSQKLDLENAVLMQELMAIKEEKAELKAQVYLLEKEKGALELRLSSQEAQEQAYLVHIEHLKTELKEQELVVEKLRGAQKLGGGVSDKEVSQDLSEALQREKKLKTRIQELVNTLEKVTKNSELRAQQSAEFVNDLKRANSALVMAFEKTKKKTQARVKKLEQQMAVMSERYNAQTRLLKQRIAMLEGTDSGQHTLPPSGSETSL
ncbi:colorectal mutant cancer protein-like isoform X2 [Limulus polyphemus]|uniref:Colorectal mutant cancer protein-like isoform X2 n=1 Tax=Limulus polyphemus TaxID=6850 RepID=A0ABM1TAY2_LIMPO|nr:colorectal mutant cancer protein-like isoform X2 [Limulus polyphemus]